MSDTPKTDHAEIYVSSFKRARNKIEGLLSSQRTLERSHNALIAKLEALEKSLPSKTAFEPYEDGYVDAECDIAVRLQALIKEAKQ